MITSFTSPLPMIGSSLTWKGVQLLATLLTPHYSGLVHPAARKGQGRSWFLQGKVSGRDSAETRYCPWRKGPGTIHKRGSQAARHSYTGAAGMGVDVGFHKWEAALLMAGPGDVNHWFTLGLYGIQVPTIRQSRRVYDGSYTAL